MLIFLSRGGRVFGVSSGSNLQIPNLDSVGLTLTFNAHGLGHGQGELVAARRSRVGERNLYKWQMGGVDGGSDHSLPELP